jgi:hypothetical protein
MLQLKFQLNRSSRFAKIEFYVIFGNYAPLWFVHFFEMHKQFFDPQILSNDNVES